MVTTDWVGTRCWTAWSTGVWQEKPARECFWEQKGGRKTNNNNNNISHVSCTTDTHRQSEFLCRWYKKRECEEFYGNVQKLRP